MANSISHIEDIPPELLKHQFEEIVMLTLREMINTIRNLEDRIEVLEKERGGK